MNTIGGKVFIGRFQNKKEVSSRLTLDEAIDCNRLDYSYAIIHN